MSTTKNMEEAKQRDKDGVNILTLPPEMLLKIFEFSVRDCRDVLLLKNVCSKFFKVAQSPILHKHVIIDENFLFLEFILSTFKHYGKFIKKLEIRNISKGNLTRILQAALGLNELTSLKIKNVDLSGVDIDLIRNVIGNCKNLESFKIVDLVKQHPQRMWMKVLEIISLRPIVEFSFPLLHAPCCPTTEWNINSFIEAKKDTLTYLKIPALKGLSMKTLAECNKLKCAHFVKEVTEHARFSLDELWRLEMFEYGCGCRQSLENDYFSFFSGRCLTQLKSVKLVGYANSSYAHILRVIAKNCPNLEILKISRYTRHEYIQEQKLKKFILRVLASCKNLMYFSFPPMKLEDIIEIDKFIDEKNCPELQYFGTTFEKPKFDNTDYMKIFHNINWVSELESEPNYLLALYSRKIKNDSNNFGKRYRIEFSGLITTPMNEVRDRITSSGNVFSGLITSPMNEVRDRITSSSIELGHRMTGIMDYTRTYTRNDIRSYTSSYFDLSPLRLSHIPHYAPNPSRPHFFHPGSVHYRNNITPNYASFPADLRWYVNLSRW